MDINSELIKKSLEDKIIEELNLSSVIRMPDDNYVGQWMREIGRNYPTVRKIIFTYRIHSQETAKYLGQLIDEKYIFKKNELINLYGKSDLIIRFAIDDRIVKKLKVLSPQYKKTIENIISSLEDNYLGEWNDDLFGVKYVYRIHSQEMATELKKIIEAGRQIKKPTLIKLYGRTDLSDYIRKIDIRDLLLSDPLFEKKMKRARVKELLKEDECIVYKHHVIGVRPNVMNYIDALKEQEKDNDSFPKIVWVRKYSDL